MKNSLYVVALGCPKNRVDVETTVALASEKGMVLVDAPETADVVLVATCGFVTEACQESINTILELAQRRRPGARLVVAGCLAQRFGEDLSRALPEADAVVSTADLTTTVKALMGQTTAEAPPRPGSDVTTQARRQPSLHRGSAYLKVADGCSRQCSFCTIPSLKGPFKSRKITDICDEALDLAERGVRELILVAQDLSSFGRDRKDSENLAGLLRRLAQVEGIQWIRPMYLYPERSLNDILQVMVDEPRVVPYLDLPIQHGSNPVLARMKRGHRADLLRRFLAHARSVLPGIFLRTTVIVGHPGEGQGEFDELMSFIEETEFDHLGAFRFSPEEDTASAVQDQPVARRLSYNRFRKVMALQRKISRRRCRALRGKTMDVLVEGPSADSPLVYVGRHAGQAPEVDGVVYLDQAAEPGSIISVTITNSSDYDLFGEIQGE